MLCLHSFENWKGWSTLKSYSDNKVLQALAAVGDLMALNLMWILCCLPVVTAGASTTALYYSLLKMVRKEETYPAKMFFRAFRQNLKQSIPLTMLLLVVCAVLYVDLNVVRNTAIHFGALLSILVAALLLVFVMVASYVFPLLAQFENTIKGTLKNALFMSLWHLPYSVVIMLLNLVPVLLFFLVPNLFLKSFALWLLVGGAGVAYLNSRLFVKIFDRYIEKQDQQLK